MTNYRVTINNINNRKEVEFENNKGEKVLMWVYTQKRENSFMDRWVERGYLKQPLSEFFWIEVFVYDQMGYCWGKYNPMIGRNHQINFDYILEANENNLYKLINKCIELSNEKEIYVDKFGNTYQIIKDGVLFGDMFRSFKELEDLFKQEDCGCEVAFFAWKYHGFNTLLEFRRKY